MIFFFWQPERALGEFVHKAFCHSAIKIHPQFSAYSEQAKNIQVACKRFRISRTRSQTSILGLFACTHMANLNYHICKQIMCEAKKEKVTLPFVLSLNQREGNDCFAAWSLSFSTGDPVYLDNMKWKGIHRWSDQSSSCVYLLFQPHVARLCKAKVLQFVVVRLLHTEPELIRPVHLWYFNSCSSIDRCFSKNQPSQWSSR